MHYYLFLLAWADGSDSACGERTKIRNQDDLFPQFKKKNKHVEATIIGVGQHVDCDDVEAERIASAVGYSQAFHANYTGHDTFSTTIKLNDVQVKQYSELVPVVMF